MNRFFRITFSALVLLLSGVACQTTRQFPTPNPQSKPLVGQLLYSSPKRTFVGDFTAQVSATDFQLEVTKGPGMSLIFVRDSSGTLARVEALGHSWQGNPRFAPGIMRNWLATAAFYMRRVGTQLSTAAALLTVGAATALAQPAGEAVGGEASLKLPDLSQVSFFNVSRLASGMGEVLASDSELNRVRPVKHLGGKHVGRLVDVDSACYEHVAGNY